MMFRVLLLVEGKSLKGKLQKALALPDVVILKPMVERLAWDEIAAYDADLLILTQAFMPDAPVQAMAVLKDRSEPPDVVVLTDIENAEQRARLLCAGCKAVLNTHLSATALRDTVHALLEHRRTRSLRHLNGRRMAPQASLSDFVSHSPVMKSFTDTALRIVDSDTTLLILGETGVGKEHLARAIHAQGCRNQGPFVAVNCGALSESLLESELFGHAQGAFTGALRTRRGCFELAHRGTIFLDEISEMPLHLQVKLLRVLQEYEVQPVGAEAPVPVDVRVMASTNRDLCLEVEQGRFRKDLFYRICVVSLTIPPLRDRVEDIPILVQNYIKRLGRRIGSGRYRIGPGVMDALCAYGWPGNVRELINILERAMLLCDREEITLRDLPESISRARAGNVQGVLPMTLPNQAWADACAWDLPWHQSRRLLLNQMEREYLHRLLVLTGGRINETAQRAGMRPRSLYDKMKRHGLRKEDFRPK